MTWLFMINKTILTLKSKGIELHEIIILIGLCTLQKVLKEPLFIIIWDTTESFSGPGEYL